MPFISARDAKQRSAEINDTRLEAYRQVKQSCQEAVKLAINRNHTYVVFTVPLIVPGHATYDPYNVTVHLAHLLKRRGYEVVLVSALQLYVSWRKQGERLPKKKPNTALPTSNRLLIRLRKNNAANNARIHR